HATRLPMAPHRLPGKRHVHHRGVHKRPRHLHRDALAHPRRPPTPTAAPITTLPHSAGQQHPHAPIQRPRGPEEPHTLRVPPARTTYSCSRRATTGARRGGLPRAGPPPPHWWCRRRQAPGERRHLDVVVHARHAVCEPREQAGGECGCGRM
ncbi:hypothetical protein H0H81_003029, partial [Sphagnurus paluster]